MADTIGKYEILELIGRGGMGAVYKARDQNLKRFVAIKVISSDVDLTDDLRARFLAEAQTCGNLSHPNIVTIHDSGRHDDRLYMVMELLDGQELKALIRSRAQMAIEEKVSVMIEICKGLHYAHQMGVVHRDIKPGNIIVQRLGGVKIIDFGIAKMLQSASMTRTGHIMGTIRYMSLEQVRGVADARSDQYSVGCVFYEFLGYRAPYQADDAMELLDRIRTQAPQSLTELDAEIPPALAAIVEKMMNREPDQRYPDLGKARVDLEEVHRLLRDEARRLRNTPAPKDVPDLAGARTGRASGNADATVVSEPRRAAAPVAPAAVVAPAAPASPAATVAPAAPVAPAATTAPAAPATQPKTGEEQEAQRRRSLAKTLIDDARAALAEGDAELCLSILEQSTEIPAPPDSESAIESLRKAALARREAQRPGEEATTASTPLLRPSLGGRAGVAMMLAAGLVVVLAAAALLRSGPATEPSATEPSAAVSPETVPSAPESPAPESPATASPAQVSTPAAKNRSAMLGELERAVAETARNRKAAEAAGAALDTAARRQAEAESLATSGDFQAAISAQHDASTLYGEAAQAAQAESARKADAAREADLAREAEAVREAEAAREAETARAAEATREAEATRQAESARRAAAARKAETARRAEAARNAEAAQEAARQADAAREAEAALEARPPKKSFFSIFRRK